jgi:hypothetical protein
MELRFWVGVIALVLGGAAVAWGYRRRAYNGIISDTPTSRVLDVTGPGVVELEGEVRTVDDVGTMAAPLSGEECVVAGWEVEEWEEGGESSSWRTVGEGYDGMPFAVDDGSGEIRVETGTDAAGSDPFSTNLSIGDLDHSVSIDDVTVDFDALPVRQHLEPDEPSPSAVEAFVAQTPTPRQQSGSLMNALDIGNAHGERKYKEGVIQPGDEVYLLGSVEPEERDPNGASTVRFRPEDAVVTPGSGDDPFVLSTRSEDELLDATRWGTPAMVAGALVLLVGVLVLTGSGLLL